MRAAIRWAIENSPAMNTLLIGGLLVGIVSLLSLRREVFPEFELEIITVSVPYPGASPEEVEEGVCQKIEEAVRAIDGIKKQTAVAREGAGSMTLELETGVDVQKVLNEVRSEIDRISTFPELCEDPEVKQVTLRESAIQLGVLGPVSEAPDAALQLREVAERVRDDLIHLSVISQATISGAKDYQIDVEIPEETLRRYGLTLQGIANIIRQQNLELPGGTIKTGSQDVLVRGKNKGVTGQEIAQIPVLTQTNGVVLTVGQLGSVRDEFVDTTAFTLVDGRPAEVINIQRTSDEDLLAVVDAVHEYAKSKQMPPGYHLATWGDRSVDVRDRIDLLTKNGAQGLTLVLVTLAFFLNVRLAFWVALGIPVSILGASAFLLFSDNTLNMLTMFAFLMGLGIVVDDAIVIGENVYAHRQRGLSPVRAALEGTVEVLPSVLASVMTTVIAFLPLLFVTGIMGKFIACLPVVMIAMLTISLIESAFILPCHLAHEGSKMEASEWLLASGWRLWRNLPFVWRWTLGLVLLVVTLLLAALVYPFARLAAWTSYLNRWADKLIERTTARIYLPALRWSLCNVDIVLAVSATILMIAVGVVKGGLVPFIVFPKLDTRTIQASVVFPNGTRGEVTQAAVSQLVEAVRELDARYREQGQPIVRLIMESVGRVTTRRGPGSSGDSSGEYMGAVTVELVDVGQRSVNSTQISAEWRKLAMQKGDSFAGAESVVFEGAMHGPGGSPIEFKLLARSEHVEALDQVVEQCKAKLRTFPGTFDIIDDSQPGKWEFRLRVKERARAMGIPLAELAQTVRASYYGEEVMRLQRGRHEVKLMVRYPRDERRSLADFEQIRVRADDGRERPLTELADVRVERDLSEINRVEQMRAVTISSDVDDSVGNAHNIVAAMRSEFVPDLLAKHPEVSVRWEGQQEQETESIQSLFRGLMIALVAMFVLLTLEFRSYFQPALIMAVIPFGAIGAVAGHALMGMPLTMFSLFGLVALTGVVVNDSIVLIDFINHRVRDGLPVRDALLDAGPRRLRPVLLTSITTIVGLLPLLLETSFQAQLLIPMATSLCFGLMVSTFMVLLLVPTFYLLHARVVGMIQSATPAESEPLVLGEADSGCSPG